MLIEGIIIRLFDGEDIIFNDEVATFWGFTFLDFWNLSDLFSFP